MSHDFVFEDGEVPTRNRKIASPRLPHGPNEGQRVALNFIADNPQATPDEIARAVGTSTAKGGSYLGRLIDNGWVQVTVSLTEDGKSWR